MNTSVQSVNADTIKDKIFDKVKQPLCIRGYFKPAFDSAHEYLCDALDVAIPVEYSLFNIYFPKPAVNDGYYFRKEMLIEEVIERISTQHPDAPYHYISSLPISEYLPSLASAIFDTKALTDRSVKNTAFFMGPDQSGTYFHYDTTDNAIGILTGTKRVYLFPPHYTKQLKPYKITKNCCKFCSLPPARYGSFPILPDDMTPIVCDVRPGDVLYIPSGWWHHVVNVGMTAGISLIFPTSLQAKFSFNYLRVHMGFKNYKKIKSLFQKHSD